jgi:hypothetical protein
MAPQAAKRDEEPVGVGRAFSRFLRGSSGERRATLRCGTAILDSRGSVFTVAARCLQPRHGAYSRRSVSVVAARCLRPQSRCLQSRRGERLPQPLAKQKPRDRDHCG